MVMYFTTKCDPGQRRKVQYDDVIMEEEGIRTET